METPGNMAGRQIDEKHAGTLLEEGVPGLCRSIYHGLKSVVKTVTKWQQSKSTSEDAKRVVLTEGKKIVLNH